MSPQTVAALAAERAAIWAYGLLGVRLTDDAERGEARAAEEAHRLRRDQLVTRLAASPAPEPAGYRLPFPVTDRSTALRLAARVEDGVAQAWRAVLPVTAGPERAEALAALTDAAVRATRWKARTGAAVVTLAFPGRP